jgi:hypothetical protein
MRTKITTLMLGTVSASAVWLNSGLALADDCPSPDASGLITITSDVEIQQNEDPCSTDVNDFESVIIQEGGSITSGQAAGIKYRLDTSTGGDDTNTNDGIGGFIRNYGTVTGIGVQAILIEKSTLTGAIENYGTLKAITNGNNTQEAIKMGDGSSVLGGIFNYETGRIESSKQQGAIYFDKSTLQGGLHNYGMIVGSDAVNNFTDGRGIFLENGSVVDSIINYTSGVIDSYEESIQVEKSTLKSIINYGSILRRDRDEAIKINNGGRVESITNYGTIFAENGPSQRPDDFSDIKIDDGGQLGILNNFQGTTGSGGRELHLKLGGSKDFFPDEYNVIIDGDRYGQLVVNRFSYETVNRGPMTFGVYNESILKQRTYTDVMKRVSVESLDNSWFNATVGDHKAFGVDGGFIWLLDETTIPYNSYLGSDGQQQGIKNNNFVSDWDLIVLAPVASLFSGSAGAVQQYATDLQGKIDTGAGSAYECEISSEKSFCVGVKGGYQSVSGDTSSTFGLLLGSARLSDQFTLGGFVEFDISREDIDGVEYKDTMPSLGGYVAYSEAQDNVGMQVKLSTALSSGEVELSRINFFGDALHTKGDADLSGFGVAGTLGYGIDIGGASVITPYAGIGFLSSTRGSYTEEAEISGVDDVLSYDEYTQDTTVGSAGIAFDHGADEGLLIRGGAGVSYVVSSQTDELKASSDIAGLEELSLEVADQTGEWGVSGYTGVGYAFGNHQKVSLDYAAWRSVGSDDYAQSVMLGWSLSFGGGEQIISK